MYSYVVDLRTMRTAAAAIVAVIALVPSALAGTPSSRLAATLQATHKAGDFTNCGTRQPSFFVTAFADGVDCRVANKVARKYAVQGNRTPLGFKCGKPRTKSSGEAFVGLCRRDEQRVKVDYGV